MKLTDEQVRRIRQAITRYNGSRTMYFQKKGIYVIYAPLTRPEVAYYKNEEQIKQKNGVIIIKCGYRKHQRSVPTHKEFKEIDYEVKKGKIIFPVLDRSDHTIEITS